MTNKQKVYSLVIKSGVEFFLGSTHLVTTSYNEVLGKIREHYFMDFDAWCDENKHDVKSPDSLKAFLKVDGVEDLENFSFGDEEDTYATCAYLKTLELDNGVKLVYSKDHTVEDISEKLSTLSSDVDTYLTRWLNDNYTSVQLNDDLFFEGTAWVHPTVDEIVLWLSPNDHDVLDYVYDFTQGKTVLWFFESGAIVLSYRAERYELEDPSDENPITELCERMRVQANKEV